MRVHPEQLVLGCVVTKDVIGKTGRPIVVEKTVLNEKLIEFLQRFLIKEVEVSSKLSDGTAFVPEDYPTDSRNTQEKHERKAAQENLSFMELYYHTVKQYKLLFDSWRQGAEVDPLTVSRLLFPLLKKLDEIGLKILSLQRLIPKEDYIYHHPVMTSLLASLLARKCGYEKEAVQVGIAGFLADCGMAKLDESIIMKKGPLTKKEYEEMKKHPTYSYRMVENISSITKDVKLGILQHHEKLDGTGYPMAVKLERIHPYARILAICDMYDAMTSERMYQERQSPFKVVEEMVYDQFGKYDHRMVEAFVSTLTNFSAGTKVRLSSGEEAEIVFIESKFPTRPMVRLIEKEMIVPLKDEKSLYIEEILN
ncbi:HD-GYP domain-containing protein [Sediminibacillus massiliensis]|uniref:HD-GYP domain-containing protein n=1 Tax=Sediminibacillus massiliensis TaxID=1926277 RepID=UPI0015C3ED70|nr:HD-GYP domain-containing protein [Sediminibacillus massiliensis]